MDRNNYWTRRVRRRRMLQGAGVGVAGLAAVGLVGCGDDDDDDDGTTVPGASPTNTTEGSAPEATATPVPAGPKRGNGSDPAQAAKVYDTVDPHRSVASPALVMLNRAQSKLLRFTNPNTRGDRCRSGGNVGVARCVDRDSQYSRGREMARCGAGSRESCVFRGGAT